MKTPADFGPGEPPRNEAAPFDIQTRHGYARSNPPSPESRFDSDAPPSPPRGPKNVVIREGLFFHPATLFWVEVAFLSMLGGFAGSVIFEALN